MAAAVAMAVLLPAARVGERQSLHERAEGVIALRPDDQVPMVGHEAVGEQLHTGVLLKRFGENALERLVVGRFLEQRHAADTPIEDVVDVSARCQPSAAGHGHTIAGATARIKRTCPVFRFPFSVSGFESREDFDIASGWVVC